MAVINDSMHYLFVSDRQKVAAVCYIGPSYTDEFLKTIHDAMETWTQPEPFLGGDQRVSFIFLEAVRFMGRIERIHINIVRTSAAGWAK